MPNPNYPQNDPMPPPDMPPLGPGSGSSPGAGTSGAGGGGGLMLSMGGGTGDYDIVVLATGGGVAFATQGPNIAVPPGAVVEIYAKPTNGANIYVADSPTSVVTGPRATITPTSPGRVWAGSNLNRLWVYGTVGQGIDLVIRSRG
jgi:hypothetical protein